jgi:hypothetical protein
VDELLSAKHVAAKFGQGDIGKKQFKSEMSYAFSAMLADVLSLKPTGDHYKQVSL